jgi:hypothetical protein
MWESIVRYHEQGALLLEQVQLQSDFGIVLDSISLVTLYSFFLFLFYYPAESGINIFSYWSKTALCSLILRAFSFDVDTMQLDSVIFFGILLHSKTYITVKCYKNYFLLLKDTTLCATTSLWKVLYSLLLYTSSLYMRNSCIKWAEEEDFPMLKNMNDYLPCWISQCSTVFMCILLFNTAICLVNSLSYLLLLLQQHTCEIPSKKFSKSH